MVDITIFIEGVPTPDPMAGTVSNSPAFREKFYDLFTQQIAATDFNLKIELIGSVTQTRATLERAHDYEHAVALLIDLDGPREELDSRLSRYDERDKDQIFFMIQRMEAWILSQTDKIEQFGRIQGYARKRPNEAISENPLLNNRHPSEIAAPDEKLKTILRQYFDEIRIKGGREKLKGKHYKKSVDGPILIGLLELSRLMTDFGEAERLISHIRRQRPTIVE